MMALDMKTTELGDAQKQNLQDDALSFAEEVARNTHEFHLGAALASDQTESRFTEAADFNIGAAWGGYHDTMLELQSIRDGIHIHPDDIIQIKYVCNSDFADIHDAMERRYENTKVAHRKEAVSQSVIRKRMGLTREPFHDTTSTVVSYALIFAIIEALIVAMSYFGQTGPVASGAAAALALAVTGAANNVGLGGVILGGLLLPMCSTRNTGWVLAGLARVASSLLGVWLLFVNMLLSHYRVAGGDFEIAIQNLFSRGFVFGDMVATLLFGFNILMVSYWSFKFYTSKDPVREYGRVGTVVRALERDMQRLSEAYPQKIRERADMAKQSMVEVVSDARTGLTLAKEVIAKAKFAQQEFSLEQGRIIVHLEDVVKFRRGIIQSLLREHYQIPNFYQSDVSFRHLSRDLNDDLSVAQEHLIQLVAREKQVTTNYSVSVTDLEDEIVVWQSKEINGGRRGDNHEKP